jgi:hypothetical protein
VVQALYCFRTMLLLLLLFIGGTEVANLLPIKLW